MEFFHKTTSFRFMRTRKVWYGLSAVLTVLSIVGIFTRGLNLAVDFTGGVTVAVTFPATVNTDDVLAALERSGFEESQVTHFGSARDVQVRLPPMRDRTTDQIREQVEKAVQSVDANAQIRGLEVVGPQIGGELRSSALQALGFTLLLIFIYVAFRFHTWRLSTGAILAALHDPILIVGFFAWTQIPFDLPVIAALLAAVGYSLNDTVVVFDRIRERFETNRRMPPEQVLDRSINETLSRTIMTSLTTLLVVLALLLLGGPVLRGFSVALMVGIMVGTYSSIYIAGASAFDFGLTAEHLFPSEKKKAIDDLP
jgi:preprotein translocase subunit SecF